MLSFKSYALLLESFKDAERKWTMAGADPDEVAKAISVFKSFKQRKLTNQDIGRFMKRPFSDFTDFVRDLIDMDAERTKVKAVEKDAAKVFENDNMLIVIPRTHEASMKYGAHTQWCITERSDYYWNHYTAELGLTPTFIIFKESCEDYNWLSYRKLVKIAVMVDTDNDIESIYRANDDKISRSGHDLAVPGRNVDKEDEDDNDEPEELNFEEFMEHYGCEIYEIVASYLSEEYDQKEVTKDVVVDYLNSDSFDKVFEELNEFYSTSDVDPDQRVVVEDLNDFFDHMHDLDWLKNTNTDDFCNGEFNRLFSDFMKRTFEYPEATALNRICDDFREWIDELRQNEDGDKSTFVWYSAA